MQVQANGCLLSPGIYAPNEEAFSCEPRAGQTTRQKKVTHRPRRSSTATPGLGSLAHDARIST